MQFTLEEGLSFKPVTLATVSWLPSLKRYLLVSLKKCKQQKPNNYKDTNKSVNK